ncbi:S8 family serine peptidase, partial [Halobium palmae]
DDRHDTTVAEIVARTAPDSELYLASVGDAPTAGRYADAIDWLVENDVDVVVDAGSYFPVANGRTSRITAAAERASERGVVFVTSAGNYANRHWTGESDGDGWVEFPGDSQGNGLAGGNVTSGRVTLRLTWDGDGDYDLYLYRLSNGGERVVAESVRRQSDNDSLPSSESIDVAVPEGRYYVSVYAHEDDGNGTGVRLFSARQTLQYATPEGSVAAPATSENVISVGAYDSATGAIRSYSSRAGGSGRVDIDAPDGYKTAVLGDFRGTSAAAPYVAGTAALMESNGGDLSPAETEQILERTADGDGEVQR